MVDKLLDPILLVIVPLAVAFLLPLLDRLGRPLTRAVHLLTLLYVAAADAHWLWAFVMHKLPAREIITGGWAAPLGINLRLGLPEAVLVLAAALTAAGSQLYLARRDEMRALRGYILQLLLVVGAVGLIMTRDLFNVFVFLEIASIGTYALLVFGGEDEGLEGGFKYMALGVVASTFILLAIAFLYKLTGTLSIDQMATRIGGVAAATPLLGLVLMLLLVGMFIELKLFPVNGPAIDIYAGADPGVMALVVGTTVNAVLFAFWKILTLMPAGYWDVVIAGTGMTTFVVSNLVANRQTSVRRLLGYSSSAQLGLVVFLLPLVKAELLSIGAVALLVINHTLAKGSLLWLAGLHPGRELDDWRGAFTRAPLLRLVMSISVLAIVGMPPFAGFFGKWQALVALAGTSWALWIIPLLLGSLLELGYYFRWLSKLQVVADEERDLAAAPLAEMVAPVLFGLLGGAGALWLAKTFIGPISPALTLLVGAGVFLIIVAEAIPQKVQALLGLIAVVGAGVLALSGSAGLTLAALQAQLTTLPGFFTCLVLGGALLAAVASLSYDFPRPSFHGLFLLLVASLISVVGSRSLLELFVGWEMMTWISYLIIAQGKKAKGPAYQFILFSGAAGFLLLAGLVVAKSQGVDSLATLATIDGVPMLVFWVLVIFGLLTKMAAFGLHVWAPGAYAESPDGFTPFLSGVVSKIPIFVFAAVATAIGAPLVQIFGARFELIHAIAWIAAISAFGLTMLALIQEDAKRLLAYSSVAQVAYIVLALSVLTPLGWYAALFHTVHHLVFKALLFFAIAGVVLRTGTRMMYQMGGLIARMPLSYISVMIGIIAVSGVPPLAGFTGKWMLYQALMEREWYLLLSFTMFSSLIAFLYLFRLVHSIFLGQLKTRHRELREAPLPLLAVQVVLIALLLLLGVWPQAILAPLHGVVASAFGEAAISFAGTTELVTRLGSFNAWLIMAIVAVLVIAMFVLLVVISPKTKKVRQLDIVFAGEQPPPPEQIHYAYDMYRPYKRAFPPILKEIPTRVWNQFGGVVQAVAEAGSRFYTGNAQTYLLYAVLALAALIFFAANR